ncbi:hypothetical protein ED312_08580 [Sinomicrobium pectinilyticum]|uniref:Lipoprotein n=1 Tax=Sinomicrobium pectinilyticum TaxID=1084421 RepID=A0A3N0EL22_SINP1|nr:hypothetical protein [Sinomicrobium pectinilyticum]RNL88494.1 hypothetical protein ED312_08580 [Sinomicrobium pectinilyticum]
MYKRHIIILLFCSFFSSCTSFNPLKKGTFSLYEDDQLICTIYRLENFQIEKCQKDNPLYAKIQWQSRNSFIMEGIEKEKKGVDTLKFLVSFKEIEQNKYLLKSIPVNSDIKYEYKAVLVKTSSTIKRQYLDTLVYLNKTR